MPEAPESKEQGRFFRLVIPVDLSELSKTRRLMQEVGRAAQLPEERTFDLQVATSEAVANAIEHAAREVEVAAWLLSDRVIVEITNDGPFQPGLYKDDERRRRGLGLPLMVSLADQVHINRAGGDRTQVSLTFFLQPADAGVTAFGAPEVTLARLEAERLKVEAALLEAERRAAEVKEGEERYRSLFESMLDGFAYCQMLFDNDERPIDFVYVAVNPAFEQLTGLKDAVGKRVTELIPGIKETNPELFELYGRVALTGQPEHFELDFQPLAMWLSIFVYSPERGYFAAVFEDITKRKQAEAETARLLGVVQDEKERLRGLLDSIADEVWFADTEKRFVLANAAALTEFGFGSAESVDVEELARATEVYRSDMSPRPVEEAPPLRALTGEVVRNEEEMVRTPISGELRYRLVNASPMRSATGDIVGAVSVVRDVTERKRAEEALRERDQLAREAEERYRNLFDTLIEGFCTIEVIFDEQDNPTDYRFLEINEAFAERTGLADAQGKRMRELAPDHEEHWFQIYGKVALTGEPARFQAPAAALGRVYDVSAYRLGDPARRQVAILFYDITERKRAEAERELLLAQEQELIEELAASNEELQSQAEELHAQAEELGAREEELAVQNEEIRAANEEVTVLYEREQESARLKGALAQVDRSLISSLEHAEILSRALEEGARALGAERAVLEISEGESWEVRAVHRLPAELVGTRLSRQEASVATAMQEADGALAIEDSLSDPRVNVSTVARYGTTAVLALPISYKNRFLGSLQFLYVSGPHRFSSAELDFAEKLTVSLALALENARLFEIQRNIAEQLQQTILEMPSAIPHLRFSHLYRAATEEAMVGGDFYDVFELEDGAIALLIGDVCGHGVNAARIATMVKASLVAFAHGQSDPDGVLALVNQLLLRKSVPGFTSLLLGLFHPETSMLTYCSAGHPELLVAHADGTLAVAMGNHPPLGVFPDWSCSSESLKVETGDILLFYTDGLTEARRDGEMFGEDRLIAALKSTVHLPLEQLPQALLDEVLVFTGGRLQDDVAVLAVQPLV